ncbi:MAG: SRPBCC family protein [Gammaproteobacteria bacterium]|nr:SRPBCC family protein [Gammaproteobacteria bacterium]
MNETTDRIEKRVLLKASRERVWRAISDARQFGTWFGVEFEGEFVAGEVLKGRMVPTKMDAEVAKSQEAYAGVEFVILVERIEPMGLLSFRWHPYELEADRDPMQEPMTLVTFDLEEAAEGTMLTITESGFDAVPLEKRAQAFASNEQGWEIQSRLIEKYVTTEQPGRDG